MNSFISEMPGPAVGVKARAPAHDAPTTIPIDDELVLRLHDRVALLSVTGIGAELARSTSRTPPASDDDGVIGYHAQTVAPPYTQPSAAALLPSMKMRSPTRSLRRTRIGSGHAKCASA